MCGRYVSGNMAWAEYHDWLEGVEAPPPFDAEWVPSWNVRPTTMQPIVRLGESGAREIALARWWFVPRWHRKSLKEWKATTFNARFETAASAPTFRASWKDRRCLVPAAGWYEWTGAKGHRTPWHFSIETNARAFCFAGLWDRTKLADGRLLDSFAILTTEPNEMAAKIHSRMPVVLDPDAHDGWLKAEMDAPVHIIKAERFRVHQVAPLKGDGPQLIEPVRS